jgi:hypothetical protein
MLPDQKRQAPWVAFLPKPVTIRMYRIDNDRAPEAHVPKSEKAAKGVHLRGPLR